MRVLPCLVALAVMPAAPAAAAPLCVRWHHALPGWGEPAVDRDAAYFLTRAHQVAAVDRLSGAMKWVAPTGRDGEVPAGSVLRLGGTRVVAGDGAIVALDRDTGRRVWTYRPTDGDSPGVFLGAVTSELVLAGSITGHLYALELESGRLRWIREVARGDRRAVFGPVDAGAAIVAAYTVFDGPLSGGVVAFDATGRRRWARRFGTGVGAAGPPVVIGQDVAVALTDGHVQILDAGTGRRRWTIDPGGGPRPRDIRALAAAGDVLAVSSLAGDLRAYDVRTRRQRWRYADGPADAVVLRASADLAHVYLPYTDGTLVAVALADGREAWRAGSIDDGYDWPPSSDATGVFAARARSVAALEARPAGDASPDSSNCEPR